MPKVEGLKNVSESAEQKSEELSYDPEVAEKLEALDQGIKSREDLLAGLGRVARNKLLNDDEEAKKEIHARKEVGQVDLKAEYDAQNFEPAEKRGWWNRFWLKEPKHNMEGKDGIIVDRRKLKPGVKEGIEQGETKFFPGELEEATEKFDLTPAEIKDGNLSMKYVEGKTGMKKMLEMAATPEDADKVAAEILEKQLKEQEKKGQVLANEKSSLKAFEKEQASIDDMLTDDDRLIYERKKQDIENGMRDQRKTIDSYKEKNLPDLKAHKEQTEASLEDFLSDLREVTARESEFGAQIEGIKTKITRMKGAKQMAELFGNKIAAWEEEKAQAELNKKGFTEAKRKINETISKLRKNLLEVERTLNRMDEIGKTPAELKQLKAEKAEKERAEKLKKEAEKTVGKKGAGAVAATDEARPMGDKSAGFKVEIKHDQAKEAVEPEESDDSDLVDEIKERERAEAHDRDALDQEKPPKTKEVVKPVDKKVVPETPYVKLEPEANERIKRPETETSRSIRFWVVAIFGKKPEGEQEKMIMKHFNIKTEGDLDRVITPEKAQKAYAGYIISLMKAKKMEITPESTWDEAARKIKSIVENIDEYDDQGKKTASRTLAPDHDFIDEEVAEHLARQKEVDENDQAINEIQKPFESLAKPAGSGAEPAAEEQESVDKEDDDLAAADRKNIGIEQQRIDLERFREIRQGKFKPRGGIREPKRRPGPAEAPAVERSAPEIRPAEDRGAEQKETEVVRPVKFWLNAIYGGKLNPHDDKIMRRHFKLGEKFDKFQGMTARQAKWALESYQIEAEGFRSDHSRQEARKKIEEIVEHIADYDREEEEAAGRAPAKKAFVKPTPVPREVLEQLGNDFDAGMAEDSEPVAQEPEQVSQSATVALAPDRRKNIKKQKPTGSKEDLPNRSGAKRRRIIENLKSQENRAVVVEERTEANKSTEITEQNEEAPKVENNENLTINNGLDIALGGIEAEISTGDQLAVESSSNLKQAEASAEENGMKLLIEAVKAKLQEENGDRKRKVRRAIDRIFGSAKNPKEIKTEAELAKAVVSYIGEMRGQGGEVALKVAEQRIADIKKTLKP